MMARIFSSATVKGPLVNGDGQQVYTIDCLWRDTAPTGNWRRAYGEGEYPQMQSDFAAWPDENGGHPDAAVYAALAHWNV